MTTKLERTILFSVSAVVCCFFLTTLHLFQHISSLEYTKNHKNIGTFIVGSYSENVARHSKQMKINDMGPFLSREEIDAAIKRIPFPQSIKNENFEMITHPAVDMMKAVKKNKEGEETLEEEEEEEEDEKDSKSKEKKETIMVPKFWNPTLFNGNDVRTFLGNYGERLMTLEEAKAIGSYTRPTDKDTGEHDDNESALHETIFVSIASYRDYRCPHTLRQLFAHAQYPERIRVAVVDQLDPEEDKNCAKPEKPCDENSDDILCKYSHLIDLYEMDAKLAVGPILARHIGNRMYRGEYFAMQSDAHMEFVKGWDVDVIQQWRTAKNEMAVLTTYVSDVNDHYDSKTGKGTTNSRPKMCNTDFDPDYYDSRLTSLMHGQQPEGDPDLYGEPTLEPFWAAGFSFSRGHFVVQVPYDQYLPMIFQGEETNIGLRGFTYGYDYYAPERSVLFHYYSHGGKDKKVKTFYEHSSAYKGLEQASMARLLGISDLLTTQESLDAHKENTAHVEEEVESFVLPTPIEWNAIEERKYGLGKVRSVPKFLATFGINIFTQLAQHHMCRFVGKPMNRMFLKHLRKDGMGIDYDKISFEFKDPVEYGQTWEGAAADDQEGNEEEGEAEEEEREDTEEEEENEEETAED